MTDHEKHFTAHVLDALGLENLALVFGMMLLTGVGCRSADREVIVFCATSFAPAVSDAAEVFQRENPRVRVRLEPSASQVAARKVSELGMTADLILVADAAIVPRMLIPEHATFSLTIATNEIVLAHRDHSRFTDEITSDNWQSVLLRPQVRLARADPDTSPLGYHTLLAWQLAGRRPADAGGSPVGGAAPNQLAAPGLEQRLQEKCGSANVVHDEPELLGLVESGAVDYVFLYRSTAEDHHLKITTLPNEMNLSAPELAASYAAAAVDIRMQQGTPRMQQGTARMQQGTGHERIVGSPVSYGLTIPLRAPHATDAARFAALLLSERGGRILRQRGFRPLAPVPCSPCGGVPRELDPLISLPR